MSYTIITTKYFDRELKYLAKRYKSIKNDLAALGKSLEENPIQGNHLKINCYKIRLAITS